MAEKQFYPMIPEKHWWLIRNQFKKTIPATVNISYLKSLLSLTSDQAARNTISPLRQMGIIDEDNKPLPRATDWRSDAKYPEVCKAIIEEIYPPELNDLFPDSDVDSKVVKAWFMDTAAIGESAAGKITGTFVLLKNGQIKTELEISKPASKPKKNTVKTAEKKDTTTSNLIPETKALIPEKTQSVNSKSPSLHIDLQIHISPDATTQQIDTIFASIVKHLYGTNNVQ